MRQWRFKFIMKKALFFPSYFGGGFGQAMLAVPMLKGSQPGGIYGHQVGFAQEPELAQELLLQQPAYQGGG